MSEIIHDVIFNHNTLYDEIMECATERAMNETLKALPIMRHYHAGQVRRGREKVPYEVHPLTMARHALAMGIYEDDLVAVC